METSRRMTLGRLYTGITREVASSVMEQNVQPSPVSGPFIDSSVQLVFSLPYKKRFKFIHKSVSTSNFFMS